MASRHLTVTHWGAYELESDGSRIVGVHPFSEDPDPSPIGRSMTAVDRARVARPSVRRSWLEGGPGAATDRRGVEPFVEVGWDTALDLVAGELDRVRTRYGNAAIFGGSYGWASAGRFHHAQSQLHRFLAIVGGYTSKRDTYSHAAAEVLVPHVLGMSYGDLQAAHTSWPVIATHADLVVAFGGIPVKNAQVQSGGHGRHTLRGWLEQARDRGTRFVNVSPLRDDLDGIDARWLPIRPNTDTAVMLALAYAVDEAGRADVAFLRRYCVGWDRLRAYLAGEDDGIPKTPEWAAGISGIGATTIRALAAEMVDARTLVNVSWSVQRSDHGEQPYWAAIALAAVLGQIGLPGGGFGLGYGAVGSFGNGVGRLPLPSPPRPENPVSAFIPVARISDLLLHPGERFDYDGRTLTYPDIHLVYWCGGNPFHHHQDLNRLLVAWHRPDTIVVHEPFWTATARRADVVLPATTPLEREDIGGSPADDYLFAMPRVVEPLGEARNDYDIFSALAERLGCAETFTEGRTAAEWIRHLYESLRETSPALPTYEELQSVRFVRSEVEPHSHHVLLAAFRADPEGHPLGTPSGRIELYSDTIAGFGYDECPGHPTWQEPAEWWGSAGKTDWLHLVSNQPAARLHSQWDHGETSCASKVAGREPIRIHPDDAARRGIHDGDVVRVFNGRGECLAGALVDDAVRPGVVQLATGAWYTPADPGVPGSPCLHGNPNVLTRDVGTSRLAQGPSALTCLVEVAVYPGEPPPVRPFDPPTVVPARAEDRPVGG